MQSYPLARELVLLGGGHSHVIFLRMLGMRPIPGLKVTLVSPEVTTPYSGMLPGLIAGHYEEQDVFIELGPLCRFAGADFVQSTVTGLDPEQQEVTIQGRPDVHYDLLSIDIGSTPDPGELVDDSILPVKPISSFLSRWHTFIDRLEAGEINRIGFVGAGAGGVELCLAVNHRLKLGHGTRLPGFDLITRQPSVMTEFPAGVREQFRRVMSTSNIQVHEQFDVADCTNGALQSSAGETLQLDQVFWITQAGAQSWPAEAGLQTDEAGFIEVDDTLRSVSHPNIFAVGDCAAMVNHPRPKAGVFAVRQGKPLYRNIRASVLGKRLSSYRPQKAFLSLVSMGDQNAIAARVGARHGYSVEGAWVWRWKDWIDRRFMQQFSFLPDMQEKPANELIAEFDDQMHCGGCGAKVGADILSEVLDKLMPGGAPVEDAAEIVVPRGMRLLQTVDHLRAFIADPYLQARIAVIHALSDIYACGGKGLSVMAMLTLPFAKPDVTRSMLTQLLRGVLDQLKEEGVELIGGHTSEGPETAVGFSVNGVVKRGANWTKQGARPGDVLVLTKPLGSGVLLAADMQFKAKGRWIKAAIDNMLISNRMAVDVLTTSGVSACTDVTGFGLAGHCREMLTKTAGIELNAAKLPLLEGTLECLGGNVRSTLHESNKSATGLITTSLSAETVFDPQTSGGLLAALPATAVDSALAALKEAGYPDAAVIGTVNDSGVLTIS